VVLGVVLTALFPPHTPLAAQTGERPDLLTLANGAVPVAVLGSGAERTHGVTLNHALRAVDGVRGGFSMVNRATDATDTEFVYALPAATVFDRLAVTDVLETPSPSQTFVRTVEVLGSDAGPDGPWTLLASGELAARAERGMDTDLVVADHAPVRWVKLRTVGGLDMAADLMFLEFSEIVGYGTQDPPPLSTRFTGGWWDRGVRLTLRQDGAAVTGCFDDGGRLEGTVSGSILRAVGEGRGDGVASLFVLGVTDDGQIRGVRSTNGAPFTLYAGAPAAEGGRRVECADDAPPAPGCGSILHGITFDFDSSVIRHESDGLLDQLARSLSADASAEVVIEGHTSSEGSEEYNQGLSERRAVAVVDALVARGVAAGKLSASGVGEARPLASNDDEAGRAMNRRVAVVCR
jgi:outer membrane protein OmpA-like peptidoglycan-associated protein